MLAWDAQSPAVHPGDTKAVAHSCHTSPRDVGAERWDVEGHRPLYDELRASLNSMRSCQERGREESSQARLSYLDIFRMSLSALFMERVNSTYQLRKILYKSFEWNKWYLLEKCSRIHINISFSLCLYVQLHKHEVNHLMQGIDSTEKTLGLTVWSYHQRL